MVQMLRELAHLLVMVCWGPGVLEFMQASFYCPVRAQVIQTGPPMAPLSIGHTHLTLIGGTAHVRAVYLHQ